MSRPNSSVCVVIAITSSTAFLETGGVVNLERAYDALATIFPDLTLHVAALPSNIGESRSILGERVKGPELVLCESMEPADLAKGLKPYWTTLESVLIHDASRPFADHQQIEGVLKGFEEDVDAIRPAMPFTETLKILTKDSVIQETLDRSVFLRISTPELIRTSAIDVTGSDCGWFLPLKANARVMHVEGNPSGLRINSKGDSRLMELQQDSFWL